MESSPSINVRPLRRDDIMPAVQVHMLAFPTFFLSTLGPRFLAEFYGSFLDDAQGKGVVAEDSRGHIIGIAVGAVKPAGYFRRLLLRRWWAFGIASLGLLLRQPSVVKRLARAAFYRGDAPPGGERALLSSIAVHPDAQGRGLGRQLMQRWIATVKECGAKACYLTTDRQSNASVNAFYLRQGWCLESTYRTPEGREMNRYVLDNLDQISKS